MLKNNIQIINFLKKSSNVYTEANNEIIIHCPYCDDALRKNANRHGHLYISVHTPVFHCFRCETSGFLGNLLNDLGFDDFEAIKELNSKFNISIFKKKQLDTVVKKDFNDYILQKNKNFKIGNLCEFEKFEKYMYLRLGNFCDYTKYLISPEIINQKLCAAIYNLAGNFVTARIINSVNNFRYIRNKNINEYYYFQEFNFDVKKDIIISEGIFDILSLYRFSLFPKEQGFYLSILGKNYPRAITWLIENHLMIGEFNIHLIFDVENKKNLQKTLFFCKRVINRLNHRIKIHGYIPTIAEDVGNFPAFEKI